jgi:hypothetical protein
VPATHQHIERLLNTLDEAMPALLKDNHGIEFWVEFLQRADAIKEQVALDLYEWVSARIDAIPVKYGLVPPACWMCVPGVG